jgi:LacI family transcriptional regulator
MNFVFSEALSLLSHAERPTAFICLGTRILAGVLQALRDSGLKIPTDASVISIGDTDLAQLYSPPITAATWDLEVVGTVAAELLLKQLDSGNKRERERVSISYQLNSRESCGPARELESATR